MTTPKSFAGNAPIRAVAGALVVMPLCLAGPALADEVYEMTDSMGHNWNMIYETDVASQAVWITEKKDMRVYVEGLAGVYRNRKVYKGFYVLYIDGLDASSRCHAPASDHLGQSNWYWGRVTVTWTSDRAFTMTMGTCDGEQDEVLTGKW